MREKRNIKLTVAYDGSRYHGFQRQKNAVSVQNVLEEKLSIVCNDEIKLAAAGRTDTGVHARGQVVNFFTEGTIPIDRLARAVNSHLPDDIAVCDAEEREMEFHARYSAKSKIYRYTIQQGETPDPFLRHYTWYIRSRLDEKSINNAMRYILGAHDFSAFRSSGSVQNEPVRTLYEAKCECKENLLEFVLWGDGFLYRMARNLVGTLVSVGRGRLSPADFKRILDGRDRGQAGATAPAKGLCLYKVYYE